MKTVSAFGPVEFDVRLIEAAVLLAVEVASPMEQRAFHEIRDALYRDGDPEQREARFNEMHGRFFVRFKLGAGLLALLDEGTPAGCVGASVSRTIVAQAFSSADEGADLRAVEGPRDERGAQPILLIRLRPRTLLDPGRMAPLLRRDLLHVADMIDPAFAYTRQLPSVAEPARDALIKDRYRVLWDTSVDGRLAARGLLSPGGRAMRLAEFLLTFPMIETGAAEREFLKLFDGPRPSHDELCLQAADPRGEGRGTLGADLCSLCRCPTRVFHSAPGGLDRDLLPMILRENPGFRPDDPVCLQCADLYAARYLTDPVSVR